MTTALSKFFKDSAKVASKAGSCDDNRHEPEPHSTDRPETPAMAHPESGRGQPARRVSGEGAGLHAEFDGAGKRAGRPAAPAGPADSTRPLEATRELATATGLKPYTEVAETLAERVARCLEEIFDGNPEDIAITSDWLRSIHQCIAGELFPDWAGRWRSTEVQAGTHLPPAPHDVPVHVKNFCLDLEERLCHLGDAQSVAELLTWVDWRFQWIHPFKDFNGRVGRILLVALAYKLGLPPIDPAEIKDQRESYFVALRMADAGNLLPLQALWLERLQ